MPRDTEVKRVKRWQERLIGAEKLYADWVKAYLVDKLEGYYLGNGQWRGYTEEEALQKFQANMVFPTIETQLPSLLFTRPQVRVEPRPEHANDLGSQAPERASLLESTLQTKVDDPKLQFADRTQLALKETFFRLGVVEVGYTADYIDNPNADKPVLKDNSEDPMIGKDGEPVLQPAQLIESEALFVKRIPARNFRVSISGKNLLTDNDWVGYCEWHYVEDVKRNKRYKNTANLKPGGRLAGMTDPARSSDTEAERHNDMVCLWKIWDLRTHTRHVFAEGFDKFLLEDEPFKTCPFAVLKFYEIPDEFYPLPPVYNWIFAQDDVNEIGQSQRTHRRRFTRRYTMKTGNMMQTELDKLESGEDGVVALSNVDDPIRAVPDAPLDPANSVIAMQESKQNFMDISGVGATARAEPDPNATATAENIANSRLQIRESRARVQVATWLGDICRIMLLTLREKMQLPILVKMNTDPYAMDQAAMENTAAIWQEIQAAELGDIDVDVKIDLSSLSPVSEDQQALRWNQVLMLLKDPATLLLLMMPNPANPQEPSPMLRKTLGFYGIKSEQEVREIMRVGQMVLMQQAMAMQAPAGGGGEMPNESGSPAGIPAAGPVGVQ